MKVRTAIEGLEFFAYHGLYEAEKVKGGKFIVDIIVEEERADSCRFTSLDEVVNYEELLKIVKEEMEKRREFIEDLAKTILSRVVEYLGANKSHVVVKITKPDPAGLFGSGAASVTLEI